MARSRRPPRSSAPAAPAAKGTSQKAAEPPPPSSGDAQSPPAPAAGPAPASPAPVSAPARAPAPASSSAPAPARANGSAPASAAARSRRRHHGGGAPAPQPPPPQNVWTKAVPASVRQARSSWEEVSPSLFSTPAEIVPITVAPDVSPLPGLPSSAGTPDANALIPLAQARLITSGPRPGPRTSLEDRRIWQRAKFSLSLIARPSEYDDETFVRIPPPPRVAYLHVFLPGGYASASAEAFVMLLASVCAGAGFSPPPVFPMVDTVDGSTLVFYRESDASALHSCLKSVQLALCPDKPEETRIDTSAIRSLYAEESLFPHRRAANVSLRLAEAARAMMAVAQADSARATGDPMRKARERHSFPQYFRPLPAELPTFGSAIMAVATEILLTLPYSSPPVRAALGRLYPAESLEALEAHDASHDVSLCDPARNSSWQTAMDARHIALRGPASLTAKERQERIVRAEAADTLVYVEDAIGAAALPEPYPFPAPPGEDEHPLVQAWNRDRMNVFRTDLVEAAESLEDLDASTPRARGTIHEASNLAKRFSKCYDAMVEADQATAASISAARALDAATTSTQLAKSALAERLNALVANVPFAEQEDVLAAHATEIAELRAAVAAAESEVATLGAAHEGVLREEHERHRSVQRFTSARHRRPDHDGGPLPVLPAPARPSPPQESGAGAPNVAAEEFPPLSTRPGGADQGDSPGPVVSFAVLPSQMPHVLDGLAPPADGASVPECGSPPAGSGVADGPGVGQGAACADARMGDDGDGEDNERAPPECLDADMADKAVPVGGLHPAAPAQDDCPAPASHVVSLWAQRVPAIRAAVATRQQDLTTAEIQARARDPAQVSQLSARDRALLESWRLEEDILELAAERRRCSPPEHHAEARCNQDSALVRLLHALDQSAADGCASPPGPAANPGGAGLTPAPAGPHAHHE